jgi:hypothetical protein
VTGGFALRNLPPLAGVQGVEKELGNNAEKAKNR